MAKADFKVGDTARNFKCMVTCYWNGHRHIGKDETDEKGGTPAIITFAPNSEIPKNFQWENWEEF